MTRLRATYLLAATLLALAVCLCCAPGLLAAASAAPVEETVVGDAPAAGAASPEHEMGTLSDRYDSLNRLSNSMNPEESVVVETRTGVLTSVNRALDGATVRFSGEAVGEVLNADEGHKWVSVADQADTAIGVYMDNEQAEKVKVLGGYHASGTMLEVTGVYHIACNEHQGELDVHTTNVTVIDSGGGVVHAFSAARLTVGLLLSALALALVTLFAFLRRQSEQDSMEQE